MSRPSVFVDIYTKGNTPRNVSARIRISYPQTAFKIPLRYIAVYAIISISIISFLFGFVYAPGDGGAFAAVNTAEQAALQAKLDALNKEIAENEVLIAQYQKQGTTLSSEIKKLNTKIAQINLQIKSITLSLNKLSGDISETKNKITTTEGDITRYTNSLSNILQYLYEREQRSSIEMILEQPKFSDFFLDINNFLAIQDNLRETLAKIVDLKSQLVDHKESLASQYDDVSQLKLYQEAQAKAVKETQKEKQTLLTVTKGQESKYQQIVAEKKKTAAEIRSRLYELIGGGELSFGDAYKLAKLAGDATGVRPALILAVLDRESALGKNVGKCKYDVNPYYPTQAKNPTTMHPTRDIPIFLEITKSLNMDPSAVFVSCPIPRDGAYGGAMGPAQFIPSTWKGYADKISSITGSSPANPWNNRDAFVGTALYMKSAGAAGGSLYQEKIAAAKYYAGGNYKNYINTYGARVVEQAQKFQEDIDVLNG